MASERHGKHNTTTISFRVNSYEKASIEERVKASGMKKQDCKIMYLQSRLCGR